MVAVALRWFALFVGVCRCCFVLVFRVLGVCDCLCIGWCYWRVMVGLFGRALCLLFCGGLLPGCLGCLLLVFVLVLFLVCGLGVGCDASVVVFTLCVKWLADWL